MALSPPLGPWDPHSNMILEVSASPTHADQSQWHKPMSTYRWQPLGFWTRNFPNSAPCPLHIIWETITSELLGIDLDCLNNCRSSKIMKSEVSTVSWWCQRNTLTRKAVLRGVPYKMEMVYTGACYQGNAGWYSPCPQQVAAFPHDWLWNHLKNCWDLLPHGQWRYEHLLVDQQRAAWFTDDSCKMNKQYPVWKDRLKKVRINQLNGLNCRLFS